MQKHDNIFKNSGIRDKATDKVSLWDSIRTLFTKETTFFHARNINTLGLALSYYLHQTYGSSVNILLATDTRLSRHWIQKKLQQNLIDLGHHVFDAGIVPTPFVAKTLKDYKADNKHFFQLGIMITASHNPAEYNGLKIMTPHGYLSIQDEQEISNIFYQFKKKPWSSYSYVKKHMSLFNQPQPFQAIEFYEYQIKQQLKHLPFKNLKVVLDCANGATYHVASKIFQDCGLQAIPINNAPDGNNINQNSGCTNPQLLIDAIKQHNADWGCAFDGDGDRVIIADKHGIIFDGDDILLMLSKHSQFKQEQTMIGTIMTNQSIQDHFQTNNKEFVRTDVGERNLIDALIKHQAQLAAETCGHVTIADHALCSDGIFAALLFFDTVHEQSNFTPAPINKYHQVHTTISLQDKNMTDQAIQACVQQELNLVKPERLIARKSNTEPVLRIMIEHQDQALAQKHADHIKNQLLQKLNEG